MSDNLDIRGGGAVAVDTATLKRAADLFVRFGQDLDEIAELVGSAGSLVFSTARIEWETANSIEAVRRRVLRASETTYALATDLRDAAAIYETVELRAERAVAHAAGDTAAVARIDGLLAGIAASHPGALARAERGELAHWLSWPLERAKQAPGALWWLVPGFAGVAGPMAWGAQSMIGVSGAGRVARTSRLSGPTHDVVVTPVGRAVAGGAATANAAAAPTSLAAAATRIPGGDDARIRVERYTMPDGTRQFAVYVAGTQTTTPGTADPFDMASNVELYTGERSASYEATMAALDASGAEPGDVVHAFGHSQGAMIAAHLALEGGYDTQTLITFGSPVEADLPTDTLSVSVRHRDDPIAALAGGGQVSSMGAPGSFVAERTADPAGGIHDAQLPAHRLEGYVHTAEMLDASDDPRMDAVRSVFEGLEGAASIEVIEYSAERMTLAAPLLIPEFSGAPRPAF